MGTTYNNAPVYKETNYPTSEFTFDNYKALMEMNKEIVNNKQGDLGVEIMSMKDFYNAGGYSFLEDYRAELGALDAAYDRALPGYGVKGEQMAQAGMTGSGYGDYLSGQAYALRASGQALARQNIMANNKAFQSDYNKYLTQQNDKREQNLQKMIEVAYKSAMDPEMFVEVATKRGISKADAERGKGVLEAYYMGVNKNQYGLTDAEQTQASSLIQQITAGVGSYANTDAIKNLILSTSTNKNAETIFNAALQQAKMAVMTDLQGMIANGESYTTEELDRIKAYYGFTDEELGSIYTDMQAIEENNQGKIDPEQQATANAYADLFKIGLYGGTFMDANGNEQTVKADQYGNVSDILLNNHLDPEDSVVKAGIAEFQKVTVANVESAIGRGQYVTKKELDRLAEFGAFEGGKDSEVYKNLIASAQEQNAGKLLDAIKSDETDKVIEALKNLGVDTENVNSENCEAMLLQKAEEMAKNGDITKENLTSVKVQNYKYAISGVGDSKDFEKIIINANQDGLTGKDLAEVIGRVTAKSSETISGSVNNPKTTYYVSLTLENGSTAKCAYSFVTSNSGQQEANNAISAHEKASNRYAKAGDIVAYKERLYVKSPTGTWQAIKLEGEQNKKLEKALVSALQYNKVIVNLTGAIGGAIGGAITPDMYAAAANSNKTAGTSVQHKLPSGIASTIK